MGRVSEYWTLMVSKYFFTYIWMDSMTQVDDDGNIIGGVPCRTDYRGFTTDINDEGYLKVTDWLKENIDMLEGDVESLRKPVIEEATGEENDKNEDENSTNESEDEDLMNESEDENLEDEEETVSGD